MNSQRLRTIVDGVIVTLVCIWVLIDPLLFDTRSYDIFRCSKEAFAFFMILPIIGFWGLRLWSHQLRLKVSPLVVTGAAFFLWNAISLLFSSHPNLGWESLAHIAAQLFCVMVIVTVFTPRRLVQLLSACILIPAVVSAGYSIIQYYGLDPIFEPSKSYYTGRWLTSGFIGQPTLFGAYLGMVIPLAIAMLIKAQKSITRLSLAACTLLLILSLLCTHTRAIMLALLISAIPFILLLQRRGGKLLQGRRFLLIVVSISLLFVLVPFLIINPTVVERFSLLLQFKTDSVGARLFYWRVIAMLFVDNPIMGFGLGTFKFHYYDYQCKLLDQNTSLRAYTNQLVFHAHNEYLQTLVETGIIGLLLMGTLILLILRKGLVSITEASADEDRCILIGCFIGLIVVLIDALVSFPFHITSTGLLTTMYSGLLISGWAVERNQQ